MADAFMLSPIDAAGQKVVVGFAQRIVVARVWTPCDAAHITVSRAPALRMWIFDLRGTLRRSYSSWPHVEQRPSDDEEGMFGSGYCLQPVIHHGRLQSDKVAKTTEILQHNSCIDCA